MSKKKKPLESGLKDSESLYLIWGGVKKNNKKLKIPLKIFYMPPI